MKMGFDKYDDVQFRLKYFKHSEIFGIPLSEGFFRLSRIENVLWQRDNWIDHLHRPPLSACASHLLRVGAVDSNFFELERENSKMGVYWSFFSRVELYRSLSFPGSQHFCTRRDALHIQPLVISHWVQWLLRGFTLSLSGI